MFFRKLLKNSSVIYFVIILSGHGYQKATPFYCTLQNFVLTIRCYTKQVLEIAAKSIFELLEIVHHKCRDKQYREKEIIAKKLFKNQL